MKADGARYLVLLSFFSGNDTGAHRVGAGHDPRAYGVDYL